jgi:putative transposase
MGLPRYLSSDHDLLFTFYRWQAILRVLDIDEIKSVPYVPLSHPFIERLIGTIRREYLDRVLFSNQLDLQRELDDFKVYYNERRVDPVNVRHGSIVPFAGRDPTGFC